MYERDKKELQYEVSKMLPSIVRKSFKITRPTNITIFRYSGSLKL